MTKHILSTPPPKQSRLISRTYVAAFIALVLLLSAKVGFGQTTIFSENVNVPTVTTLISAWNTAGPGTTGFQNNAANNPALSLTYGQGGAAAPGDVRATTPSGVYAGASAAGNVFIATTAVVDRGFSIENINASGATSLQLTFGFLRINAVNALRVEYWNGTAYVNLGLNLSGGTTNVWQRIGPIALPPAAAIAGLRLRFIKGNDGTTSYRLDDILLTRNSATAYAVPYTIASAFSTTTGTPSAAQSITVGGSNLGVNNVVVGPLTGYEFSLTSGGTYTSTLTLTPTAGSVAATPVFARLTGAALGTFNGNVPLTSTGAPTQNIAVTGSVIAPGPSVASSPTTLTNFSTSTGTPSTAQVISVSGTNLSANLTVGALSGYEFSTTAIGGPYSTAQVSLTPTSGTVAATNVWVRLTGAALGTFNGPLAVASTGATTVNVTFNGAVTAPTPTLTVTPATLNKFITVSSAASDDQRITVSGVNLSDDIIIGPLTGYEFASTLNGAGSPSITLLKGSGTVAATDVYFRLFANPVGIYNGTLNITSIGATTITRPILGQAYRPLSGFSPGNLAVARLGEINTVLSSASAPYFVLEYTKAGVKVDSGLVPVTAIGANKAFTVSGNSTTSGLMNLSPDRKYLVLAGTSAPVGLPSGSSTAGSVSSAYPKVVARIGFNGALDATTSFNDAFNNNNMRAATTLLGNKFWASGTGDINTGGVKFGAIGATVSTNIVTGAGNLNNTRYIQISNSQLYISTNSGTTGIYKVGTGLPESTTTFTNVIATPSPESFSFVDADPGVPGNDLVYIARDGGAGSQGVAKFKFNGTSWSTAGVIDGVNILGVYAEMNGTSAEIYFTTATLLYKYVEPNAVSATLGGTIGALATILAIAPTNTNFHGITLTPENVLTAAVDLNFSAPGAATVPQGTANKVVYRTQFDVSLATATLTDAFFTTSGSYATSDLDNFKLWLSSDNVLDLGDILLATDASVTGFGENITFNGLGQAITAGTQYLFVTTDVSGCAAIGATVGITSTPLLNFGLGSANVTGTPAAGSNYSVSAGTPAPITGLILTRGQQNLPIVWDALTCSDNYLVVVHTAPINGTPTGTYAGANLNYAAASAFTGGGRVVFTGTGTTIDVTGLTVGTLYYVKIFNKVSTQYSTGVQDTATAKNTVFYSRASGTILDPIWTLSPTGGIPATAASLGGFSSNKNVFIQTGHNVTYNASGSLSCLNLTVNATSSFSTVSPTQSYVNVFGNITNNGTFGGIVGAPANAEFTSINISGATQTWSGSGVNNVSRIQKNGATAPVTSLTFNANVNATFPGAAILNVQTTSKLNIIVNAGKFLNANDPSGTISLDGFNGANAGQIGGSLTVNGSVFAGSSILLQNNNTTATYGTALIIGATGNVLTQNFTADLTGGQGMTMTIAAGGNLSIRSNFTVASGTVTTNGIKLEVNPATGTPARLLALTGAANVTGTMTIEQKIPTVAGWHFMTAPVKGATFTQWSELSPVIAPKNNASLFTFTEGDTTRGTYNGFLTEYSGWKVVNSLSDPMNPLNVITGYRVFGRTPFITTGGGKVAVTGQPFTGIVPRLLTKTATGFEGGGWNLTGNPYPSEIDWDNVVTANPGLGIDQAVYIYNGTTKSYGSYVGGTGTNGVTDKIAMSQGFMVYVSGAAGTLNFRETDKASTGATFLRDAAVENQLRLSLSNGTVADEAVVKFTAGATLGADQGMDSRKLNGSILNISSMPEPSLNLQINAMPELVGTQNLKLNVLVYANRSYTLTFTGMESFAPGVRLYLKDNYLGTLTDISVTDHYTFNVSAAPASSGTNRFELVASTAGATSVTAPVSKPSFSLYPNPAQNGKAFIAVANLKGTATAVVYGVDGSVKSSIQFTGGSAETVVALPSTLTKGVYTVRISTGNSSSTQKLVVE